MKESTIVILGQEWYVTCLSETEYNNIHSEDKEAEAFTDPNLSTITINERYLTTVTIIHELVHAYTDVCCAGHSEIDKGSYEEIIAEIFGRYGRIMIKQADDLLKEFRGGKEKK